MDEIICEFDWTKNDILGGVFVVSLVNVHFDAIVWSASVCCLALLLCVSPWQVFMFLSCGSMSHILYLAFIFLVFVSVVSVHWCTQIRIHESPTTDPAYNMQKSNWGTTELLEVCQSCLCFHFYVDSSTELT